MIVKFYTHFTDSALLLRCLTLLYPVHRYEYSYIVGTLRFYMWSILFYREVHVLKSLGRKFHILFFLYFSFFKSSSTFCFTMSMAAVVLVSGAA